MLTQKLRERYSYDPDVKQWSHKYCGQYYGLIQQYLWNPSDLQTEFSSLKAQNDKLQTGEFTYVPSTMEDCFDA